MMMIMMMMMMMMMTIIIIIIITLIAVAISLSMLLSIGCRITHCNPDRPSVECRQLITRNRDQEDAVMHWEQRRGADELMTSCNSAAETECRQRAR